jgi:acetyl esterase/lipase
MISLPIRLAFLFVFTTATSLAQIPDFVQRMVPQGTRLHHNIPYAGDTLKKHLLDIYLPPNVSGKTPLIIWVHGGAWKLNDKYADMGYMKNTIRLLLEKGYALASIDYRHSTTKIFPAQMQDCNLAVRFLHEHADQYKFDKSRFILMGFSAGGHLASLLALSNNQTVPAFYADQKKPSFTIRGVVDFYGPSDFMLFFGTMKPSEVDNPIAELLGTSPLARPDLSALASPVTYVDKNDPPFYIVHGEKDNDVPPTQSYLLRAYLSLANVPVSLTIVKDAPHYGEMFDTEEIRTGILNFLQKLP